MATGSPPALWEGQQTRLLGFSAAGNPGSVTLWSSAVRNLSTGFQLFGPSRLWRQVTVPPSPAQSHHSHCFSASPAFREASPRADWPSPGQVRTLPAGEVVEAGEGMAAKTGSPPQTLAVCLDMSAKRHLPLQGLSHKPLQSLTFNTS